MSFGYSGTTEDGSSYRVMPRDGGECQRLKISVDTDKVRQKEKLGAKARQLLDGHKQAYGYRRLARKGIKAKQA